VAEQRDLEEIMKTKENEADGRGRYRPPVIVKLSELARSNSQGGPPECGVGNGASTQTVCQTGNGVKGSTCLTGNSVR